MGMVKYRETVTMNKWRRVFSSLTPRQQAAVVGMLLLIAATWLAVCLVLLSFIG